jgi:hypothetical protein
MTHKVPLALLLAAVADLALDVVACGEGGLQTDLRVEHVWAFHIRCSTA